MGKRRGEGEEGRGEGEESNPSISSGLFYL